ncbi:MAG: hypothetical protein KatS3mg088_757 [Patescibacteria group bacterium]|nr:MAG: hypothetical protein KatS3mg088_757 [Patescibacteria group bacterium]
MNKPQLSPDKVRLCQISITTIILFLIPNNTIRAQTATPVTSDTTVSVTFKVVEGETPTPTATTTPTPITSGTPTPTISPQPQISPTPTPEATKAPQINLKIFGYGPPDIPVSLVGKNILELTTSNEIGYFEFRNIPLPEIKGLFKLYPELCLQGYYKESSTQPVCLPRLPVGNLEYNIGPVILSPIIIIEKGEIASGEQVKATGKTTPNSEVSIYLAKEKQKTFFNFFEEIKLIKTASAYYLPKYQTTSNANGDFEFNLPSESPAKWRLFSAASFQGQNSPKSNTLSYLVVPKTFEFFKNIIGFLISFFSHWFSILIAIEIVSIIILLYFTSKD